MMCACGEDGGGNGGHGISLGYVKRGYFGDTQMEISSGS